MDSVNFTTFIKKPLNIFENEAFLLIKEKLSGKIFLGFYKERRHVSALNTYRDVVVISYEETDLQHDLKSIIRKCLGMEEIKWVGITGPEMAGMSNAYCFWVKLTNLPFGHYWFQIKNVKFMDGEVILHLKCIRKSLPAGSTMSQTKLESSKQRNETAETGTSFKVIPIENNWDFDSKKIIDFITATCIEAQRTIEPHLTWKNFVSVIRITCAITVALITAIISFLGNLGEYFLKLLREITLLVHALTPLLIQIIDFFSKVVGGFYILLAGLFLRRNQVVPLIHSSNSRSIPFSPPVDWRERNQSLRKSFLKDNTYK